MGNRLSSRSLLASLSFIVVLAACSPTGRTPITPDTGTEDPSITGTGEMDGGSGTLDAEPDDPDGNTGPADAGGRDGFVEPVDASTDALTDAALTDAAADAARADAMVDAASPVCAAFDLGMATGAAVAVGDLTGRGNDWEGSCGSPLGEDVAYTWTPPASGAWTFDTFGSDADTVLRLHLGTDCMAAELGCNDDTSGFQSRVDVDLVAGAPVTIIVDSYDASAVGPFTLRITETSSIAIDEAGACTDGLDNDLDDAVDCSDSDCALAAACELCPAETLGATGTITGTTTGEANNRVGSCGGDASPDRTHLFTAPTTGSYAIDTAGSSYDTVLYVLASACDGLEVTCNDDGETDGSSSLVVGMIAGQSIVIVVDGFDGEAGSYNLNIASTSITFGAPTVTGDLVITEIMQNPEGSDAGREWFEVVNTTARTMNLNGCIVSDLGSDDFTISTNLLVRPGEFAVFAESGSPGGFRPSYDFANAMALSNADDEIIITCAGIEIDRVEYDGGPAFVTPSGATMSLSRGMADPVENDRSMNWCAAPSHMTPYDEVNRGSPGAANPDCP